MSLKGIIPCAGLGTRCGMLPHQSKELLPDPETGKPLIDYSIELCHRHKINPIVITRPEKKELIDYVTAKGVEIFITEPGQEWPGTILKAYDSWGTNNVLMLPDVRYSPTNILDSLIFNLLTNDLVFALHSVDSMLLSSWGIVTPYATAEKPATAPGLSHKAWGVIGFKKSRGKALFEAYSTRGEWFDLVNEKTSFLFLDKFEDVTRK